MANTTLTATSVTREALRILHQKLNFVGTINRAYDSSFGKSGAKIGDRLKIRLPNQYTVRSGAALSSQDVVESSVTLQVATQKGVDTTWTSDERSHGTACIFYFRYGHGNLNHKEDITKDTVRAVRDIE